MNINSIQQKFDKLISKEWDCSELLKNLKSDLEILETMQKKFEEDEGKAMLVKPRRENRCGILTYYSDRWKSAQRISEIIYMVNDYEE